MKTLVLKSVLPIRRKALDVGSAVSQFNELYRLTEEARKRSDWKAYPVQQIEQYLAQVMSMDAATLKQLMVELNFSNPSSSKQANASRIKSKLMGPYQAYSSNRV